VSKLSTYFEAHCQVPPASALLQVFELTMEVCFFQGCK
jgi:hypothetical protein